MVGYSKRAVLTEITACRSCGGNGIVPFFDLGNQPFANSLLESADQTEGTYPLALAFCPDCSLVQLTHTAAPEALFSHYLWVTGTSSMARAEAARFCDNALKRLPADRAPRLVVELASNDGTFLRPFLERSVPVLGIDPAANVTKEANANGVPTLCAFFDCETACAVLNERGPADLVIVRNVLPHVAAVHSFVDGIATLIGDHGLAMIEFHYGHKILEGLQYDSIYHEHLCYLTAGSVQRLLAGSGLSIVDVDEGPIGGGALIVYAKRNGAIATSAVVRHLEDETVAGTNTFEAWQGFARKAQNHRERFIEMLDAELAAGYRIAGYGASARSSTMLNFCGIDSRRIFAIADANPMKQGRFAAGTRIPIRSAEEVLAERPNTVVLLAWNFRDELLEELRRRGFRGRVIVPLPNAPVLQTLE
jgi:hypothetical protein